MSTGFFLFNEERRSTAAEIYEPIWEMSPKLFYLLTSYGGRIG
jgi:hypothetical protein